MAPGLAKLMGVTAGVMLAVWATLAWAEDTPAPAARAVVVLDSSNAMLNPIETFKKYYWVRKTLQSQLATPLQGVDVGLVAYGAQRRPACDDVAILRPVEPFDAARFFAAASSVRPRGQTPVSEALNIAAAALGSRGGKVLLIAGSADSCQQDPCATAKDLVAAEPGLLIDVLSIGASDADAMQMQCIAEAGHGHVFAATTMADTSKAMAEAFAALPSPGVALASTPQAAPASATGLNLAARLTPEGAIVGLPITWLVRAMEAGKPGAAVFRTEASIASAPLPPGSYDVEAIAGPIDQHQPVDIAAGKVTDLTLSLDAASLRLKAPAPKADDVSPGVVFTIYRSTSTPDDDTADATVAMVKYPLNTSLLLPPGTYRISATRGALHEDKTVTLAAGQDQAAEFALSSGKLIIEPDPGADPKAAPPIYFISEDDPDQPLGHRDVAQSASPNPIFELPPGVYHISSRQGFGKVRLDAVVKAGEVNKVTIPLTIGRLRLETHGLPDGPALPDDLISYTVQRLGDDGVPQSVAARGAGGMAPLELEPGAYRVTGKVGPVNITLTSDVTVRPSQESRAVLAQQVGVLALSYGEAPALAVDVLWEIRDAAGKPVWSTTVPDALVPVAPGSYTVHVLRLGKDQSVQVSVAAGERKSVAVQPE